MKAQNKVQSACDVKVEADGNSLRLSFPKRHTPLWEALKGKSLKGKPNYLYLTKHGFSANEPDDWKRANQIAIAMESDLDHPEWDKLFDITLAKYGLGGGKYAKLANVLQLPGTVPALPEITVGKMWEAYLEWKKTVVEETTFANRYSSHFSNALNGKKWDNQLRDYSIISDPLASFYLCNNLGINNAVASIQIANRRYFVSELNHAFEFCKAKGLIVNSTTENPFTPDKYSTPTVTTQQKYASKIVNGEEVQWHEVTDEKELENDRRAFTKVERDIIIKSFYASNRSAERHIAPLIEFLFLTGCRPSESLPLTWKDIDCDRNVIRFSKAIGRSVKKIKDTKTGEIRLFYFSENSRLKELLLKLKSESTNTLIFPSTKSKHHKAEDITRAWTTQKQVRKRADGTEFDYYHTGIVSQLVNEGAISGYLAPYHTRHTYITLTAQANAHNNDALLHIATACGNSVDVILRHYLGRSESVELVEV